MKAIQVKYIGPTNTKGSRWKAWAEGVKPIYVPYSYSDRDGGAYHAAWVLCEKHGWPGIELRSGVLPNGDCVFCFNYIAIEQASLKAA